MDRIRPKGVHGAFKGSAILAILLAVSSFSFAQSVTLPSEIKGAALQWIIVTPIKVDGGKVKWRIDPDLQEVDLGGLLPPEMKDKLLGKVVTYNGGQNNVKFKVEAWNAKGDVASEIAVCWIVIGKPGPGPSPLPDPPLPVVPDPADHFTKAIVLSFASESATDKAKIKQYAALYSEMSAAMLDSAVKPKLKTVKDVWDVMGKARDKVLSDVRQPTGYLRKVGAVIGEEFNTTLAIVETAPMTEAAFLHFSKEFARVAKALEACR